MKKLTNVMALTMVLGMEEVKANPELVEKLEKMLAQFEKKNGSSENRKPTKTQLENEGLKTQLIEILSNYEEPKAIKELQAENEEINATIISNQKISALFRQLIQEGKLVRVEEKRVAKFILA